MLIRSPIVCFDAEITSNMHFLLSFSELFTNALDMLSTLLATLPFDFYICFSSGGEDGKKTYSSCVKRLKSELTNINSVYGNEIRQLFPLTPKPYEVITVRTAMPHPKGSPQSERVRVSDRPSAHTACSCFYSKWSE